MRLQAVVQQIEGNRRQKWRAKKQICHDQRKSGPYRNKVVLMKCHSSWLKLGILVITRGLYKFLELFCNDEFFQLVVYQSNFRRAQPSTKGYEVAATSKGKRHSCSYCKWNEAFFWHNLFMGNHKLPNRRMYLGNFADVLAISATMTRNWFNDIISLLHFSDNTTTFPVTFPNSNKLHKIQTIVEHFRSKFKETVVAETFQAIDEMMVPFKDKHRARVNMP